MKWLSRSFSHGSIRGNVRHSQYAARRILKKIGLRRNQPLTFPIPQVLDDFTKLARLNFERLKDADPQLRNEQTGDDTESNHKVGEDEAPSETFELGSNLTGRGFEGPKIRYFPNIVQSPDSKYTFDPKTNTVTSAKTKIDQDVDEILQTFRDLQLDPPNATLPTSHIRLVRSGPFVSNSSKNEPSWHDQTGRTHLKGTRSYATLSTRIAGHGNHLDSMDGSHALLVRKHLTTKGSAPDKAPNSMGPPSGEAQVRERLRMWADTNENDNMVAPHRDRNPSSAQSAQNVITQSGEDDLTTADSVEDGQEEDYNSMNEDFVDLDSNIDVAGVAPGPDYFTRGDLVEVSAVRSRNSTLAIFVKNFKSQKCLLYAETGRWVVCDRRKPLFSKARFVHPKVLNDLLIFIPPIDSIETQEDLIQIDNMNPPRSVGQQAREHLLSFRSAAEDLYRRFADRLDRSYSLLAPDTNEDGSQTLSLQDAVIRLFQLPLDETITTEMQWIVHRTLSTEPHISFFPYNHRQNPLFYLIPKENTEKLLTVQKWVRQYQEMRIQSSAPSKNRVLRSSSSPSSKDPPLESFARKARELVAQSREQQRSCSARLQGLDFARQYRAHEGKRSTRTSLEMFDENDRIVIEYLRAWTASHIVPKLSPMNSAGPAILRVVGAYEGVILDQEAGFTFLQELGIFTSSQNAALCTVSAGLPGFSDFHPANRLQREAQQEVQTYQMQDSMAEFRKDWGQLPVYCIDPATTSDIDDGISIELIPETTEVWLHVHVANPTAFIRPESAAAQFANKMTQTTYLPETKIPMLDRSLTKELSLGEGKPCITFSAKVNPQGVVLEDAISHGIIHNVLHLTRNQVDEALGFGSDESLSENPIFSVGKAFSRAEVKMETLSRFPQALTGANILQLKQLHAFAMATNKKLGISRVVESYGKGEKSYRQVETALQFANTGADSQEVGQPNGSELEDAIITIKPRAQDDTETSKTVMCLMVLAGQICGAWCAKRNIPVPYRGFILNPEPALKLQTAEQDLSTYLQSSCNEQELAHRLQEMQELGFTSWSPSPATHPLLNSSAYVQATSPLRRYGDMILHWQIEAVLRLEREQGKLSTIDASRLPLPFSHDMVTAVLRNFVTCNWQRKELRRRSNRHWFVLALHRAFYLNEAELPLTFKVQLTRRVNDPLNRGVRGQLLDFGEDVQFDCEDTGVGIDSNFRLDDIWEVRIAKISVYFRMIHVVPIRLVQRVE